MPISIETLISKMEWAQAKGLRELTLTIDGYDLTLNRDGGTLSPQPEAVAQTSLEPITVDMSDVVTAPVAGLCLLSPEPNEAPFVAVGDVVEVGQTLCMIEAMKVMIPLTAPHGGTLKEVLVADNSVVVADAQIMRIS